MDAPFLLPTTRRLCLFPCPQGRRRPTPETISANRYSFTLSSPRCSCSTFGGCSPFSTRQLTALRRKRGLHLPVPSTPHPFFKISARGLRLFLRRYHNDISSSSTLSLYIPRFWRSRHRVAFPHPTCPTLARP